MVQTEVWASFWYFFAYLMYNSNISRVWCETVVSHIAQCYICFAPIHRYFSQGDSAY
jgi:hypothetical protein